MKWDSRNLVEVYRRLIDSGVPFVVVGGQAVNLWTEYFTATGVLKKSDWAKYAPLTSHDLDTLNSSSDVEQIAQKMGVERVIFEHKERTVAPNSGTLYVPIHGEELILQCLFRVTGTEPEEVRKTAIKIQWEGLSIPTMHPLLCLEGKVACLCTHPQAGRQDEKHVRLSILNLNAHLKERLLQGDEMRCKKILTRVIDLLGKRESLRLFCEHDIQLEDSIPMNEMESSSLPKMQAFITNEWSRRSLRLKQDRETFIRNSPPGPSRGIGI